MRLPIWGLIAATAAFAAAVGPAAAMQCYTVLDRSDNVVYRGTVPPIDLSERGDPEREAMRQHGQHLIAMDADRCPGVEFFTGTAGTSNLSVDQIVGGIKPLKLVRRPETCRQRAHRPAQRPRPPRRSPKATDPGLVVAPRRRAIAALLVGSGRSAVNSSDE